MKYPMENLKWKLEVEIIKNNSIGDSRSVFT